MTEPTPMPEAKPGDPTFKGKHLACRACNLAAVEGDLLLSLCGEFYESDGTVTSTVVAIENQACPQCITLTGLHLADHHPERLTRPPVIV